MSQLISLNEVQIEDIRKLARDKREYLGIVSEGPIGDDIFTILERLGIILLEYPIQSDDENPAFSAAIMYSEEDNEELTFIGLNTADYFDKQVFAIAHELYHYFTKTGSHISRLNSIENSILETKANRFAAEFLFPEIALKSVILEEFKKSNLTEISDNTLMRFIVRLQCSWWLPFRSIIKRLNEITAISQEQYDRFYNLDVRNFDSDYSRTGLALDREIYRKLNTKTNIVGISARDLEIIIRNFEDGLINEDKFAEVLELFNKTPDDFGYKIEVSDEDLLEFDAFFSGGDLDED